MNMLHKDSLVRAVRFVGIDMNRSRSGHGAKMTMSGVMGFTRLRGLSVVPLARAEDQRAAHLLVSRRCFWAVAVASSAVALALCNPVRAAHAPTHKRIGSYDINIGVVSAVQAQLTPSQMGSEVHRSAAGRREYHVVASVRDVTSGDLVANATIRAQVGPLGMSTQTKSLDAMVVNGEASYGNYFAIPGREPYTVHLWIEGSGASAVHSEAVFTLRRN